MHSALIRDSAVFEVEVPHTVIIRAYPLPLGAGEPLSLVDIAHSAFFQGPGPSERSADSQVIVAAAFQKQISPSERYGGVSHDLLREVGTPFLSNRHFMTQLSRQYSTTTTILNALVITNH